MHRVDARGARGAALPIVLMLIALLLALSVGALDSATLAARTVSNWHARLRAVHAADGALMLCERELERPAPRVRDWNDAGEPGYWRWPGAFDGPAAAAFDVLPAWPGAARAPQCLIERWTTAPYPEAQVYLLTARGFGPATDTEAWIQVELVIEPGRRTRHWRSVASHP